jgi:DNA (cytosine-5)-methyltransferase 1
MLLGHTPVCAVELDAYCRKVLQARQADGWLPQFAIYEDVRKFDGTDWRGRVDVVAGGFPCQPWSQAGKQKGADDPRHLWPEMARIVEEVRPTYVFAENVSLAALEEPWRDLRGLGYRVPPALCVAASDVGAPHIRKRWWLLAADADGHAIRLQHQPRTCGSKAESGDDGQDGSMADADSASAIRLRSGAEAEVSRVGNDGQNAADADEAGLEQQRRPIAGRAEYAAAKLCGWWQAEPPVGRVVDGMADRVGQLRALGNGQVPMAAATAWHYLMRQLGK